jgi:hypothetical protein
MRSRQQAQSAANCGAWMDGALDRSSGLLAAIMAASGCLAVNAE